MTGILGGLTMGEIPIAGTKRRSIGIQIGGRVHRIGRVWANRAFVVVRGNLRLLYVARRYGNYAAVAKHVFDDDRRPYDYDHVLGRALCRQQGFDYILMARLPRKTNRSHGRLERPQAGSVDGDLVRLDKFCFADERILLKLLGIPYGRVPAASRVPGYRLVRERPRGTTVFQAAALRQALGMSGPRLDLKGLAAISG